MAALNVQSKFSSVPLSRKCASWIRRSILGHAPRRHRTPVQQRAEVFLFLVGQRLQGGLRLGLHAQDSLDRRRRVPLQRTQHGLLRLALLQPITAKAQVDLGQRQTTAGCETVSGHAHASTQSRHAGKGENVSSPFEPGRFPEPIRTRNPYFQHSDRRAGHSQSTCSEGPKGGFAPERSSLGEKRQLLSEAFFSQPPAYVPS